MSPVRCGGAAALWLLPAAAHAHGWGGTTSPVYDGILHVLLNPVIILSLAGAALLAGRRGREQLAEAQIALALGVAAGALATVAGLTWSAVALANRLFIVVAGLLVALDPVVPQPAVLALVVLAGALSGHELLVGEASLPAPVWFCVGSMLGAMVLQGAIGGLTLLARASWARLAIRIAGSWLAAIGIIYAGFLLLPVK